MIGSTHKFKFLRRVIAAVLLVVLVGLDTSALFAQTSTTTPPVTPPPEPTITSVAPAAAAIGAEVTIIGTGFLPSGNVVKMDGKVGINITRFASTSISFRVPSKIRTDCSSASSTPCTPTEENVRAGSYAVTIKNANGESDPRALIVSGGTAQDDGRNEGDGTNLGGIAKFVATCAITSFAGNAAKGALSGIVSNASSWIKNNITSKISGAINNAIGSALGLSQAEVPTNDKTTRTNTQQTVQNTGLEARKEVSLSAPTGEGGGLGGIVTGIANNLVSAPSWDALAFCIGNELIHYITESTIQWANSGFKGKPVFIENANAYFGNIADQEAGLFIQNIFEGSGIDVCQPFRVQLGVDTIRSYNSQYGGRYGRGTCSLSVIKNNYEGFLNNWNQGGLPGWFELIQKPNNIYGAQYQARAELQKVINQRQNSLKMELDWSRGYQSYKYCEVPRRADGSCPPGKEKTGTPGQVIENTLNQRIGSSQRRLEIADEFDELVSALVNALIKTAINEVFSIGSSSSGGSGNTGSGNRGGSTYQDLRVNDSRPTVSIVRPQNNSSLSGAVTINANAADAEGIAWVQFRLDNAVLPPIDTAAPYEISWNTILTANGNHQISAVVRDTAGQTATSTPVNVSVFNADGVPPTISLAVTSGTTVTGTTIIYAEANDNLAIRDVQFKLDGANLQAPDTTPFYGISWNSATVANGQHVLTAVARDNAGNTATSSPVTITVSN